jgi:long-chain acyl-CoA synthetase
MRQSLLEFFFENASSDAETAFTHRPKLRRKSWTYVDIARLAFQVARELEARTIGRGDRVVIWAENSPEWVAAFWGIIIRGAIAVPLDEQSALDFVQRVCDQTSPKLLLYGHSIECSTLNIPSLALQGIPATVAHHSSDPVTNENIRPSDAVEIVFTSGTTATPKGVVLTHENLLANLAPMEREIGKYKKWTFIAEPLKVLCVLPLSHVFGQMMGIFVPQMLGAEVVFQTRLNPSEIVDTIKREKVTILASVPRVLETLERKIERDREEQGTLNELRESMQKERSWLAAWWKYRRIRRIFGLRFLGFATGGATLDESTETFWRRLGYAVVQGYGMTETAALVSLNNPFSARRGSLGQILAGRQNIKIGDNGEILVRGKNISPGYWGEEKRDGGDEWLATGDVGAMDETGRLYFKGRQKDVIVTAAGLNIYPDDLESALNSQPQVISSAVVAIETVNGPEPAAALILKLGSDAEKIVENANKALAPFQQIRRWIEWPDADFPRTSTQKIRKNIIAETIAKQLTTSERSSGNNSVLSGIVGRLSGNKRLDSSTRLSEDLNLDSMSRVELISAIEDRYQVDLDEQVIAQSKTVGDIEKLIRGEAPDEFQRTRFEYPWWTMEFPVTWIRAVFYPLVIYPITRILCRVNVRGTENLANIKGPVLFASNHITYVDPPIVMSAMPWRFRQNLAIAMDGERQYYYRHPPPGTRLITRLRCFFNYWLVIALFNAFPLPRQSGFRESFSFAGEEMDRGYNVLIFPEGELTKDGSIQKFKSGVGLLANGLEATVVPVAITGLYELRHAGQRGWAPPGSVTITFDEAIEYDSRKSLQDLTDELESKIREIQKQ